MLLTAMMMMAKARWWMITLSARRLGKLAIAAPPAGHVQMFTKLA
jgi:hypothetical protein